MEDKPPPRKGGRLAVASYESKPQSHSVRQTKQERASRFFDSVQSPRHGEMEAMSVNDYFRLLLGEMKRRLKSTPIFRDSQFACAELFDPLEPDVPFIMRVLLPQIEREWHFSQRTVPPFIKLTVGRAARRRAFALMEKEYRLPPAERYELIECMLACERWDVLDPDSWGTAYACAIRIPTPSSPLGIPIFWWGSRAAALTIPLIRSWFFSDEAEVWHGPEAVNLARRQWNGGQA